MADYETIRYEVRDGVARLTLDRPERLNAMTNRMLRETYECLSRAAESDEARVLVLTGEGRGFCPGADLLHYTSDEGRGADDSLDVRHFRAALLLHEMPQVTIAAVNGACAGAGLGWACACDFRFAAESAVFNTAFLSVASAGDMGGPWTLPRIVGAARARELYFLPGKFGADEALRLGLVSRVYPDASLHDEVEAITSRLAEAAPLALRSMKANFVAAERLGFADYIDSESERHLRVMSSPDAAEAFRAFVEKRAPRFAGR
jgi:2-(1,2-epoxy-1,2-dihydrophenyl)acetyl-CoA isomerase